MSKHKLIASSYEELTREGDSSDEEPAPPKRVSKNTIENEEAPKEPVIVARVPRKQSPVHTNSTDCWTRRRPSLGNFLRHLIFCE
ncbi:hypothetical protein EON65_56890 [archaeon]|nr:MAG: hypothetical protein EON65_56890 [archaeon]